MKNKLILFIKYIWVFIISLILFDLISAQFLVKEIKEYDKYKVEITDKSNIPWTKEDLEDLWIEKIDWYPYWDFQYRWPTKDYEKNKKLSCRILWIWGSITWWAGVYDTDTYFYKLSEKLKSSEIINLSIPGSMPLQQIIKLDKEGLLHDSDLLIWWIRNDDFTHFSYSNGILYNSEVTLNEDGYLSLFNNTSNKFNEFLVNNSLIYNKLLKIKLTKQINSWSLKITEEYILWRVKKKVDEYLSISKTNKAIFLVSPYLGTIHKEAESIQHEYMYTKFKDLFKNNSRVSVIDLEELLDVKDLTIYSLDDIHYNEEWNKALSKKIYDYINNNKILDEKCY